MAGHQKDRGLAELADRGNVAQFVSFDPRLRQRFSRIRERPPDESLSSAAEAVRALLDASEAGRVNVRSFLPESPKGHSFDYGLSSADEIETLLDARSRDGLYTIINETIDVDDGGVSGVVMGHVAEFAPDDTPRCVEQPGVAHMSIELAVELIRTVYAFEPDLKVSDDERLEFSVHPQRVGYRGTHTLYWEIEHVGRQSLDPTPSWPNRFSRHLGDKAFGLLMGSLAGLPVPRTTVVGRRVAPFAFGRTTGTGETWLRTCPTEQQPGRFTTTRTWLDPFALLQREDPDGSMIVSVLAQEGVDAQWSGATVPTTAGQVIEGVRGSGDAFMSGDQAPDRVPNSVVEDVRVMLKALGDRLGAVRIEWAHDGDRAWLLQLHLVRSLAARGVIVAGEPREWLDHRVEDGLEQLRNLINLATDIGAGILLHGDVGVTSHVGDLLRRSDVPARFAPSRAA